MGDAQEDDQDLDEFEEDVTTESTTESALESGGLVHWFREWSFLETLLIFVCGICLLVLALSIAYFYTVRKLGWFSDNPWYKRRMYYAMTSAKLRDPARSFNVYKRERPNTLSLNASVTTPPKVIIPVPTKDAAVGDSAIHEKHGKHKHHKGKSSSKYGLALNAVGPMLSTSPNPSSTKSSVRHHHRHTKSKSSSKYTLQKMIDDESNGEEGDVYVTPPQDAPAHQKTKDKAGTSTAGPSSRSRKK